jgi:hypothetical protein
MPLNSCGKNSSSPREESQHSLGKKGQEYIHGVSFSLVKRLRLQVHAVRLYFQKAKCGPREADEVEREEQGEISSDVLTSRTQNAG